MKLTDTTNLRAVISSMPEGHEKQQMAATLSELEQIKCTIENQITDFNYAGETQAAWIVLVVLIIFFTFPLWMGKVKRLFGRDDDDELFGMAKLPKRELVIYS